jgi:hypothetical protein
VFIAGLAFWLSFTALTHLAMRAGIAESQAWAWPLIVDGIIVVATVSVVALRDRKGHRYSWLLLVAGALVSVTANAIQAAMPAGVALAPSLAAAVSAVPPIVLLLITHLTVVLARHEDQPKTEPPAPALPLLPVTPLAPAVVAVPAQPELAAEAAGADLSEADFRELMQMGKDRRQAAEPEPAGEVGDAGEMPRTLRVEEAIRLKEEGLSNRVIGKRFGVDPTTIGRWLREAQARSNTDE